MKGGVCQLLSRYLFNSAHRLPGRLVFHKSISVIHDKQPLFKSQRSDSALKTDCSKLDRINFAQVAVSFSMGPQGFQKLHLMILPEYPHFISVTLQLFFKESGQAMAPLELGSVNSKQKLQTKLGGKDLNAIVLTGKYLGVLPVFLLSSSHGHPISPLVHRNRVAKFTLQPVDLSQPL